MEWHEPRKLDEAGKISLRKYIEDNVNGDVLVYNPCDGWHLLWLTNWNFDDILRDSMFEFWMPGPPSPC